MNYYFKLTKHSANFSNNKILPSLQFEMTFDNSTANDSSGNNFPVAVGSAGLNIDVGGCNWQKGGKSNDFRYPNHEIKLVDVSNSALSTSFLNYFNGDFTMTLWARKIGSSQYQRILSMSTKNSSGESFYTGVEINYLTYKIIISGQGTNAQSSGQMRSTEYANEFAFFVIKKTNNAITVTYMPSVNNSFASFNMSDTFTVTGDFAQITSASISHSSYYLDGKMDNIRLFNKILTDTEIQTVYNSDMGITI